jgi:predicted amidohydrolase
MCSNHIVEDNLKQANSLINQAIQAHAELIVLPECFSHLGLNTEDKLRHSEKFGVGRVQEFLAHQAQKHSVWIVGGAQLIRNDDESIHISSLIFDPNGECVGRYNKNHLFKAKLSNHEEYSEASIATKGTEKLVADTPFGKIGFSICFDLRFPEHYQQLYQLGAEILLAPSSFTYTTGKVHWEVLCRSRALDTFSYVIAPAQCGKHTNGFHSYGHSMVVSPWGEVIGELKEANIGVLINEIHLKNVFDTRKKIIKE